MWSGPCLPFQIHLLPGFPSCLCSNHTALYFSGSLCHRAFACAFPLPDMPSFPFVQLTPSLPSDLSSHVFSSRRAFLSSSPRLAQLSLMGMSQHWIPNLTAPAAFFINTFSGSLFNVFPLHPGGQTADLLFSLCVAHT